MVTGAFVAIVDGVISVAVAFIVMLSVARSPAHPTASSTATITMHNATATRSGLLWLSGIFGRAVIG